MTKISLIIPCFNEAKNLPLLISRCQEINNKDSNIEIIIVDNGSTDNTSQILEKFASGIPYITTLKVEKNLGYGHGILEGLREAKGDILGWTHADLQTDPKDAIEGLVFFEQTENVELLFVKGRRYGRPLIDVIFTVGMSFFESLLMKKKMWDINAQPTLFHRSFFEEWKDPPKDFSLDLFAYFMAKRNNLNIKRFPVLFGERAHGISHWNVSLSAKYRFIKRTLYYSLILNKRFKDNA
jgi:glycosyltransferase involved in cell wall biosynthesis